MIDERLNPARFGIFADSEALGVLEDGEVHQEEECYVKSRPCEYCSQQKSCYIPWSEIYCLMYSVPPHQVGQAMGRPDLFPTRWVYNPRFKVFHPDFRCSCHPRALVIFDMTPTAAERLLRDASKNGNISQSQRQIIQAIAPVVAQIVSRQAGGGRVPPGVPGMSA